MAFLPLLLCVGIMVYGHMTLNVPDLIWSWEYGHVPSMQGLIKEQVDK